MVCWTGVLTSTGNWKTCLHSQNVDRDSVHEGSDGKRLGGTEGGGGAVVQIGDRQMEWEELRFKLMLTKVLQQH